MLTFQVSDLYGLSVGSILQNTYFYDNLKELEECLPIPMVEYLQSQFFSYHKEKYLDKVDRLKENKTFIPLPPGPLPPNAIYKVYEQGVYCDQFSDFALLPSHKYPNQLKGYNEHCLFRSYCNACWYGKVTMREPLFKTVIVKIRHEDRVIEATGHELYWCKFKSVCYICDKPLFKVLECLPKKVVPEPSDDDIVEYRVLSMGGDDSDDGEGNFIKRPLYSIIRHPKPKTA